MGIRGLTTFIANRSSQYLDRYELHDSHLVIDGNSLACQLYKWHCRSNDCFGGDYDKYSKLVYDFFQLLSDANVTPFIVFDGAYEKRKMKTVYSRMRNRISAAKDLNSVTEGRVSVFPLFQREVFVDVVLKLQLKCVRCEFEGDSEAAHLARALRCPLLSYDSDFYIFDVLYIPFSTMDLRLRRNKVGLYILCEVYRVEKFLKSFGGLDKSNLPLLAVILGNDYIKKKAFSRFFRQLKKQKTKQNEQQTLIKSVIVWLKNETTESALRKILGRYKLRERRRLTGRIQKAIGGYQWSDTQICSYFNIDPVVPQIISVPKPEDVEEMEEEELENDAEEESSESENKEDEDGENEEEEEEEDEDEDEEDEGPLPELKFSIPNFFRENFRKCLYPSSFMDMIVSDTYYFIPQIDNFSSESSHNISFGIVSAMHKILTFPKAKKLVCVGRNERGHVKKFQVPVHEKAVPKLSEIENLDASVGTSTLLQILNVGGGTYDTFPNSWRLFLLSIKYWVLNSKTKVELPYIYSVVLCAIILNYVDAKVGFYRSTRSFFSKFGTSSSSDPKPDVTKPARSLSKALDDLTRGDGIDCMRKLINYFQMDAKMKCYVKLFERNIVHQFAQLQSCLLHIKHLNALLNFPLPSIIISDFYDGTFLYNMTTNLLKRSDLKAYMKILLCDCPTVLNLFELMVEQIEQELTSNVWQHEAPRKRRKRKKTVKEFVPEVNAAADESEEEFSFDSNNKYSLLNFINK